LEEETTVEEPLNEYEYRVQNQIDTYNVKIDQLEEYERKAGPDHKRNTKDEISALILQREAVKRGLLRVNKQGDTCSACRM
jgi:hypothetical protein